jgi:aminoglycoside phosphotransferase (APT) family kinase protein
VNDDPLDNLRACLPRELDSPTTVITRIAAGLSGAGVYRVGAGDKVFVLKISTPDDTFDNWRARLEIQQHAAQARIAPAIVHVDEARRAVVSEFVVDRSFPALLMTPQTRATAIELLSRTLRAVHELPIPANAPRSDARAFLSTIWSAVDGSHPLPPFVGEIVARALATERPEMVGREVVSHNDVNPSNLVYDGERVMLLDWDVCGVHEPFYDLATISVFMRMDDESCRQLLEAYDGSALATLPARFSYDRRLVASLCGTMFLYLAVRSGRPVMTGVERLEDMPTLSEFYQRMRAGEVSPATPDGQRQFAMAMLRESARI